MRNHYPHELKIKTALDAIRYGIHEAAWMNGVTSNMASKWKNRAGNAFVKTLTRKSQTDPAMLELFFKIIKGGCQKQTPLADQSVAFDKWLKGERKSENFITRLLRRLF